MGPLGFELSDRYLKRAGLDYWPYVNLQYHDSLADFQTYQQKLGGRLLAFSTHGTVNYADYCYQPEDWLMFGCETQGLPKEALESCDDILRIPMAEPQVRSLNLSVSVAIGLFEARRQLGQLVG